MKTILFILFLIYLNFYYCEEYGLDEPVEYDYEIWNIGAKNLYIPRETNSYSWRRLIPIPFQSKRQISKIKAVIESENAKYIESIYLFRCIKSFEILMDSNENRLEWIANRVVADHENKEYRCWKLLAVWAQNDMLNKTLLSLPESMGIPINGENSNEKYLLFEINYKNSDPNKDLNDSSGFELYIHKQNTWTEADIVVVGAVPDYRFFIPPNMKEWIVTGNCYKECLQNHLFIDGLTILDVIHYTKPKLLKELNVKLSNKDNNNRKLVKALMSSTTNQTTDGINLKLGNSEHIMIECKFSSINQSNTVLGGMSGADQNAQCMAWILYYPKIQDFDVCLSSLSLTTIMSIVGIDHLEENWRTENDFDIVIKSTQNNRTERLENYLINKSDWDYRRINRAKYVTQFGKQTAQCNWKRSFFDQII